MQNCCPCRPTLFCLASDFALFVHMTLLVGCPDTPPTPAPAPVSAAAAHPLCALAVATDRICCWLRWQLYVNCGPFCGFRLLLAIPFWQAGRRGGRGRDKVEGVLHLAKTNRSSSRGSTTRTTGSTPQALPQPHAAHATATVTADVSHPLSLSQSVFFPLPPSFCRRLTSNFATFTTFPAALSLFQLMIF